MFGDLDELFIPVQHPSLPAMLDEEMGTNYSSIGLPGRFYYTAWAMNSSQLGERYGDRDILPNISLALVTQRRDDR